MSTIKMTVVNSTVGLGDTEYSLSENKGMLKYDKAALDECCEIINQHDKLTDRVAELEALVLKIRNITGVQSTQGACWDDEIALEHSEAVSKVYELSNQTLKVDS